MAIGIGKTRTIMALIDALLRANAAQKILFLADRDSLVNQALTDGFKQYLQDELRTRIRTFNITKDERVYVTTLQQHQIVSEIEKLFSEADNLEKAIDESLQKAESLRQSMLKKAFEGKLVN